MAFLRPKSTGFRCAVACPNSQGWAAMFLRPSKAAGVSERALLFDGATSAAYGGQFADLSKYEYQDFALYPDAVLQLPAHTDGSAQYLFITGTDSLTYRVGSGAVWHNPLEMLTWLPADWKNNVDALLQAPNSAANELRTYLFKGNRVITYNWSTVWSPVERNALITEGPDADSSGWAKLPSDFRSDLDHVVALPPATGDVRRSLLVKGAKGLILNWRTGVEKSGALTSLATGPETLPAPYVTPYLPVSGTYRATDAGQTVEIRVDVDGAGTLSTISGDLFTVSGETTTYTNSFRSTGVRAQWSDSYVMATVKDLAWATPNPDLTQLRILLALAPAGQSPPAAHWLILENGETSHHALWYGLPRVSAYFRTVDYEVDTVVGETEFASYDTAKATTPPGYADRIITVPSAFAEAGIEMRVAGTRNVLDTTGADADLLWSDAELHAAMVANFSAYRDVPQWKLWTLVAGKYAGGASTAGIMFDYLSGLQRQGAAVFAQTLREHGLGGVAWDMHTYVHEIGHAFNLVHAWEKGNTTPPAPLGPRNGYGDLSWMNYPHFYQGETANGIAAFWGAFPFRFSEDEIRHLRHGFYRNVIMGGTNWNTNSAMDLSAAQASTLPLTDESGLALEIEGKETFEYGEPVVAQFKLSRTGSRGDILVTSDLQPSAGHMIVAVTDPSGRSRTFRPLTRVCAGHDVAAGTTTLTQAAPALYASTYLGYGADGLYFGEPGLYKVSAAYQAPDGSRVVSAPRTVRVRQPVGAADQHIGELLMGDDQGQLLTFLGSDAPQLQGGNDALQEVIERYGDHPLAVHARLSRGANAGRHFQHIADGRLTVREPDIKESVQQLSAAINASTGDEGLDNITLNKTMRRLATVHAKDGNLTEADAVLNKMVTTFRGKHLPAAVQKTIQAQAEETRATIHHSKPKTASRKKK
ncbi:hypothetical protein GCM10009837_66690 [Streptomyces durmitorensis]|uniref:Uncharacterized protein n=1 Tax=Streptomyces durmitorensis TaxID=319947 RepID=A0ABY4Q7Q1_9ACTN|nr:hypothetical protein [Streptomyces durmitorensis]UQT61164.1 hypothetical protein M4V62_42220 [Streptomyces durmitorensis]